MKRKIKKIIKDLLIQLNKNPNYSPISQILSYYPKWKIIYKKTKTKKLGWVALPIEYFNNPQKIQLFITQRLLKLPVKFIRGFILHEILHFVMGHFYKTFLIKKDDLSIILKIKTSKREINFYIKSLWNLSADLEINNFIQEYMLKEIKNIELINTCISDKLLPFKIRQKIKNKPAEEIFKILKKEYLLHPENLGRSFFKQYNKILAK